MSKNKKTTNWIAKHKRDPFVKKSKKANYRSRAIYKLIEINEKYKVFSNAEVVIDLGCAPGSWLQYICEQKNIKKIIGIDILDIDPLHRVDFIRADIADSKLIEKIQIQNNCQAGVVLSDIAPNITGIADIDQSNFAILAMNIIEFCKESLKKEGFLVMKYFNGSSLAKTKEELIKHFKIVGVFKPSASKQASNEIYLVCNKFKPLV
ncbi:MAG: RlmE family RNA methyltransferase [Pseudomonadota bacterium]|nr:RlmE family RNA methyltransferase [Pseudomonadota bacterium]